MWCKGCNANKQDFGRAKWPEFVPQSIRDGRKKYSKELLQPFRQGQVSKEYLDAYPTQREGMIKEGIITEHQANTAKNVWHNDIY